MHLKWPQILLASPIKRLSLFPSLYISCPGDLLWAKECDIVQLPSQAVRGLLLPPSRNVVRRPPRTGAHQSTGGGWLMCRRTGCPSQQPAPTIRHMAEADLDLQAQRSDQVAAGTSASQQKKQTAHPGWVTYRLMSTRIAAVLSCWVLGWCVELPKIPQPQWVTQAHCVRPALASLLATFSLLAVSLAFGTAGFFLSLRHQGLPCL